MHLTDVGILSTLVYLPQSSANTKTAAETEARCFPRKGLLQREGTKSQMMIKRARKSCLLAGLDNHTTVLVVCTVPAEDWASKQMGNKLMRSGDLWYPKVVG